MNSKARPMNEPYSGSALEKKKKTLENSTEEHISLNKTYLHENGFKWLINSRGYVHVWIKEKGQETLTTAPLTYYLIIH